MSDNDQQQPANYWQAEAERRGRLQAAAEAERDSARVELRLLRDATYGENGLLERTARLEAERDNWQKLFHEEVESHRRTRRVSREQLAELTAERDRLRAAIVTHHAQHADDLCYLDDDILYTAAGLPARKPQIGDPKAMLRNCKRFIRQRCFGGGPWKSYAELEAEIAGLTAKVADARWYFGCPSCGEDHPEDVMCPPHEVRTTGREWFHAAIRKARAEIERLRAQNLALTERVAQQSELLGKRAEKEQHGG